MSNKEIEKVEKIEKVVVEEKKSNNFSTIFLLMILIGAIFGFNYYNPIDFKANLNNISINSNLDIGIEGIQKFSSEDELKSFLEKSRIDNNLGLNYRDFSMNELSVMGDSIAMVKSAGVESVDSNSDSGTSDFSNTNNQEEGVDEADIVKTDGKYIYTISQNKVIVVNAYPATNLSVVSTIKFDNEERVTNLFIYNSKLVVFTNSYDKELRVSTNSFVPEENYVSKTNAKIYDLVDSSKPKLINEFSLTGRFSEARLIGSDIYFIAQDGVNFYNGINMPRVFVDDVKIGMPEVFYFGAPYSSYNFHNIASFDLDNLDDNINVKSFMLGSSNTMYFSENNIYITYPKYYSYNRFGILNDVIVPLLDSEIQNEILDLSKDPKIVSSIYSENVIEILEKYYNTLSESDKKDLFKKIQENSEEYYYKQEVDREKTVIQKISIDDGKIEYVGEGLVKGHLLNQFSLDENKKGDLRLATTTSIWSRSDGREQFNNVIILDSDLKEISEITNLAEDEKIYSTRFLGDKLYMVTFKQIDPLFVIDLSDSKNPKVLGELKIPGYSTYLHPYDETHLIGIGYDTKESEWGGVVNNGVKLSLFDVSDFENPKEVDNYIISGRFTDSIALHEHKAFLFSKAKNLISMPIREFVGDEKRREYIYSNSAFIFSVDKNDFEFRGKVTHEKSEIGQSYWYNSPSAVKRSLYLDDVLYTVSDKYIVATDLNSIDEVEKIGLGYDEENNKYYY